MTRNGLILYLKAYLQARRARLHAENGTMRAMADERYERLKAQELLPEGCESEAAVEFLIGCLRDGRAKNLSEAASLWDKEKTAPGGAGFPSKKGAQAQVSVPGSDARKGR